MIMPFKFNALTGKFDFFKNSLLSGEKFYFDTDKNSYLWYNSTTSKVEIVVDGTRKQSWG